MCQLKCHLIFLRDTKDLNSNEILKYFIILLVLICTTGSVYAQSRKELESTRKKYKSQIKQLNSLLFTQVKKEKNVLEDLKDIKQKIAVRNKLINTINLEAKLISNKILKMKKR